MFPIMPATASPAVAWSLDKTCMVPTEQVPQSWVFTATEAPTEAVDMLNKDKTLWPNLCGRCYVWSAYKKNWYKLYLMWPGTDAPAPGDTANMSSIVQWQSWSLENTMKASSDVVPHGLVFNGTQFVSIAVKML